jgi:outer membrane protein TolC
LPGQRRAQAAVADADLGLAQAATAAGRLHYAGLVREAAWNVTGQRSEGDLAETQLRYLQDIAEDVKRRVAAGDLAPADALAAQSEVLGARSVLLASRQRQGSSEAQWKILTGLDAVPDLLQASEPADPASFSADSHPEMQMAALNVERLRKRLDLVAANRRDPMELQFRIRQDMPGRGESAQNSIGVGVRVPLGTAGRNEPLQAAALSELDVAETAHLRIRDRLTAEAATAQAAVRSAELQLEAEGQRASLLRERAALIDRSFKAGETALPELLRALVAAAQADTNLARQKVALGLAHARLQQAFGILP